MDYEAHYNRLITRGRTRALGGYKEKHHIVPKCEGGPDDPANLVSLTAREHFIAHLLLAKWKGGVHWKAVKFMSELNGRVTSKIYAKAKYEQVLMQSGENSRWYGKGYLQVGELNHMYGKTTSDIQKTRASEANRYKRSEETRKKMALARVGKAASEATRKKMSEQRRGRKLTEEHKVKIGAAAKGREVSEETRRKMATSLTKEERSAASRKSWETRRKNKEQSNG